MLELTSTHMNGSHRQEQQADALASVCDAAVEWLITSGIQVKSPDPERNGGYACWYEKDTQSSPYVYAEITGYMLTLLSWLHARTRDPRVLNSATRAADWLIGIADDHTGGFPCLVPLRPSRFEYKRNLIYAFDCGVILSGLVNVFRATQNPKHLAAAVTVADWLVRDAQLPTGGFLPVYDIDKRAFTQSDTEWSLCPGSYHTKVAIGLINLFAATQQERYFHAAVRACDFALTFQQPDGRFVSFPSEGGTNAHPHEYSAEGLWVVGKVLSREDYLDASAKATAWLFSQQSPEGYVPRHFHNGTPSYVERVDVLAQALRLAELHRAEGRVPKALEPQMAQLVPLILRNQSWEDDPRTHGAFYFGRLSNGALVQHANVWVTSFAIQALALRDGRDRGHLDFDPLFFV